MKFEDYQRLAALLKEAREILFTFKHVTPKKAPINKHHDRAVKGIDAARSSAEEMMFKEYPEQANTDIFY